MENNMLYTPLTKKALKLCFDAHKEQVDKTGLPYVFHPFHLAEQMNDEISTVCALLHDVIEDTEYTFSDLSEMGFPKEVIEVLRLLTHEGDVPYMEYVEKISHDPIATRVKLADLRHNSDVSRMDEMDEWAVKRNEKYLRAIDFLLGASDR
jgi:(p)ppGpp synthase/HD superfamily hydrolase